MADFIGHTFAGFEVVAKLGQGGMGAVYKARQTSLNRFVALKVMSSALAKDMDFIERFKREAATAAQFKHPNIVEVYTAGESNGTYYIAMDFVEGRTLREHIRSHGRLAPQEAIAITLHVAEGLKYAWNKSRMIHRDIKPDNIFLSQTGEVLVGDLGLAKNLGGGATEMTSTGMTLGSPHYISPEQAMAAKDIDFRADIYSLGCTLFHMLTGRTPYDGHSSLEIVMKHVNEPPPLVLEMWPQCPGALGRLVSKMMAKTCNERHQSYEELITDLFAMTETVEHPQSALTALMASSRVSACEPTQRASQAPVTPCTVRAVAPKRRWPATGYAVASVAVAVIVGGLLLWSPWHKPASQDSKTPSLQNSISSANALKQLGSVFTNSVGAEMVYIPPGEFMLGSTKEEQAWAIRKGLKEEDAKGEGERQRKTVINQGCWFGRTEVTVGQWKQFVAATGYKTDAEKKGYVDNAFRRGQNPRFGKVDGANWRDQKLDLPKDNQPVCCVGWNDAMEFCAWLTKQERKEGRLSAGQVVRLPTEAEWEYACRAGTQARFWWGDSEEGSKGRVRFVGTQDYSGVMSPVNSFGKNGWNRFGLADMLGNVAEWCLDGYDPEGAHGEYYNGNPSNRVVRGGSCVSWLATARCARRGHATPGYSNSLFGFRVCMGADVTGGLRVAGALPPPSAPKVGKSPQVK